MKVVVDTSILVDHLRGGMAWRDFLARVEKDTEFFIPTIVIFELYSGKNTQEAHILHKVVNLVKLFQKIELDEEIAIRAGELYRDVSKDLQVPDYIIAASALKIGGTVITLNKRHFQQIPGLSLYPLNISQSSIGLRTNRNLRIFSGH